MLYPTNSGALRTRSHPVRMNHLLEIGLDLGRGDSALDHFRLHLPDQVEVEEVHYSDFHFQLLWRVCTQR